jgi:hypothetical protein
MKTMRWTGQHAWGTWEMNVILVGKPEVKRALGRPRNRWKIYIGMDLREIGWEGVDWMHLAQNRAQ